VKSRRETSLPDDSNCSQLSTALSLLREIQSTSPKLSSFELFSLSHSAIQPEPRLPPFESGISSWLFPDRHASLKLGIASPFSRSVPLHFFRPASQPDLPQPLYSCASRHPPPSFGFVACPRYKRACPWSGIASQMSASWRQATTLCHSNVGSQPLGMDHG